MLTLRFDGRDEPTLTRWQLSHPNAHNSSGTPRASIKVDRSDLRPIREGKLAIVAFLLLGKLWGELKKASNEPGSSEREFFWEGRAKTPANSLYDTLHSSKDGWVDVWFGFAPLGGPDGGTKDVIKRLAGLLIIPSLYRNRTAREDSFKHYKSTLVNDSHRYEFSSKTSSFKPLFTQDIYIEWSSGSDDYVTDPIALLALAVATLEKGSWQIKSREDILEHIDLPESLKEWLDAPGLTKRQKTAAPPIPTNVRARESVRVSIQQITEITAETQNLKIVAELRAFKDVRFVSEAEKLALLDAIRRAIGLADVVAADRGSLWLTLLLTQAQALKLSEAINEGQFDAFGIYKVQFRYSELLRVGVEGRSRILPPIEVPSDLPVPYRVPFVSSRLIKFRVLDPHERGIRPRVFPGTYPVAEQLAAEYVRRTGEEGPADLSERFAESIAALLPMGLSDPSTAEETWQEICLELFNNLDNLELANDLGIPEYVAQMFLRGRRRAVWSTAKELQRRQTKSLSEIDDIVDPDMREPIDIAYRAEIAEATRGAIARLRSPEREYVLGVAQGLSSREIASRLEIEYPEYKMPYRLRRIREIAFLALSRMFVELGIGPEDFALALTSAIAWSLSDQGSDKPE